MKKAFVLSSILLPLTALASPLTPEQALSRALKEAPAKMRSNQTNFRLETSRTADGTADGTATLYVFTRRDQPGFIVTSAQDITTPLLGISTSDFIDENGNCAPECEYWLGELSRQIAYAAENSDSHPIIRLQRPEREAISPLCATQWNQSWPYNNLCPELNGSLSVTGCAATSTAQAMKYHNWPSVGEGSHSYDWTNGSQTLSIDFSETPFDWSSMTNTYSRTTSSQASQTAVATLMKAVGYSIDMNYSPSASGATSIAIGPALANYFKYNKALRYLSRDWFSLPDWEELIYNSLQNYGPVIYNGQSTGGGHSFICDGYSSDGLFHINWGWGGISDGYFLLDVLNPYDQGIGGGSNSGFIYYQDIICDIRPDTEGNSTWDPIIAMSNSLSMSYSKSAGTLTASGFFYNPGPGTPDQINIGFEFTPVSSIDLPEGEKSYVLLTAESLPPRYGYTSLTFSTDAVPSGRSICQPIYSTSSEESSFKPVYTDKSNTSRYLVHRTNSTIRLYAMTTAVPEFMDVSYPSKIIKGDTISITGTMLNTVNASNAKALFAAILTTDGTKLVTRGETQAFTMEADETLDFEYYKPIDDNSSMETGTYSIALACADGGNNNTLMLLTEPAQFTYDISTGIFTPVDEHATATSEYYTIDGARIATTKAGSDAPELPAGVYIVKTGTTSEKIVIK